VVAAAALSLFAMTANAQQPPATAPVAPVKPAAPVVTKPAVSAPAATTVPATTAKKPAAKAASACKGLDETACKANAECGYIVPKKADPKTGKVDAPYCRKVAGVAVKKPADAAAKAAAPVKAAVPAVKTPTAPAPATKQ